MMELNSSVLDVIQYVEAKPVVVLIWSTLGMCILVFILLIPLIIIKKSGVGKHFTNIFTLIIGVTLLSLAIGFITQLFLFFADISGLKMLIIWIVMFCTNLIFVFTHQKSILKWASIKKHLQQGNN